MYEQSLEISREIGEKRGIVRALTNLSIDKVGVAISVNNLAVLLLYRGDIAGAKQRDSEKSADHARGVYEAWLRTLPVRSSLGFGRNGNEIRQNSRGPRPS
jgi:hypothetical protein